MSMMRWDIFCRVVDNLGDIGTCWRLARQLAEEHGAVVRLWVDDLETFALLSSHVSTDCNEQVVELITVRRWTVEFEEVEPAEIAIEAFACELPGSYVTAMASRSTPSIWINLEYLSAESWVDDCHLQPSLQPYGTLRKYFFFPGFTSKTGGLIKEQSLLEHRAAFDMTKSSEFLESIGVQVSCRQQEIFVSLFCYRNPAIPALLHHWSRGSHSIRLLTAPGVPTDQVAQWLGQELMPGMLVKTGSLSIQALPYLSQSLFDQLLWSCDLNFVRGEDSFVRAQWAQRVFVWQIYPQSENAHLTKLNAFLDRYLSELEKSDVVRRFWMAWNGIGDVAESWNAFVEHRQTIQQHGEVWVNQLDRLGNLADNLVRYVRGISSNTCERCDAS